MAVLKLLIFSLIFVYFLTIHIQNLLYCSFFVHNFAVLLIKQEFLIIQEVQYQTAVILLFSNDIINGNRKSPFLFSSLLPFFPNQAKNYHPIWTNNVLWLKSSKEDAKVFYSLGKVLGGKKKSLKQSHYIYVASFKSTDNLDHPFQISLASDKKKTYYYRIKNINFLSMTYPSTISLLLKMRDKKI